MLMKIGKLAEQTGCKVVTIRFYEQKGLLKKGLRTSTNYRLYDEEDLDRLNFIMHCRDHNLSLKEIQKILTYRQKHEDSCAWVGNMIEEHIKQLDKQINSLKELKKHLRELRHKCNGDTSLADCAIVKQLHRHINCAHKKD